jgi:protein tyrosine/serine phosphatase
MTDPRGLVPLVGALNFRDLGGYPTDDGRQVRSRQLFRSDTLSDLSDEDLVVLADIGLATIIDLRTPTEVEREGRGPLENHPINYINLSVLPEESGETVAAPPPMDAHPGERYLWYLEVGKTALATALQMTTEDEAYPLVFHCAAGKDRTGVLAALVLGCLGVRSESIVEDYAETEHRIDEIVDRLRRIPAHAKNLAAIPPERLRVQRQTMEVFLEGLEKRHGGAIEWALEVGIPAEALERMREHHLEECA